MAKNTTLTILPGTVIDLKLANFIIDGTLNAKGTETNWIVLQAQKRLTYSWPPRLYFNSSSTPWDENTGTGLVSLEFIGDYSIVSNIECTNSILVAIVDLLYWGKAIFSFV